MSVLNLVNECGVNAAHLLVVLKSTCVMDNVI